MRTYCRATAATSASTTSRKCLTTSPFLLDRYLTVALRVADMAIGNPDAVETARSYPIPFDVTQTHHFEGMPIGTRGGTKVRHNFPADGEYVFSGRLFRGVEEGLFGVEGHDRPDEFLVLVDGQTVFSSEIAGKEDHELAVEEGVEHRRVLDRRAFDLAADSDQGRTARGHVHVARANHARAELLAAVHSRVDGDPQSVGPAAARERRDRRPAPVSGISDTPSRKRLFVCHPAAPAEEPACAKEIFSKLARARSGVPVTEPTSQDRSRSTTTRARRAATSTTAFAPPLPARS